MNIIVTGATGMVGGEVVRMAADDPGIERIFVIARRPPEFKHHKLTTILHEDFLDYSSLGSTFKDCQACLWCLGISQNKVADEEEYVRITFDYATSAAKAMVAANPDIKFIFLSGFGADPSEKRKTLFAR